MKPIRAVTLTVALALEVLAPGLVYGHAGQSLENNGILKGFEGEVIANGTNISGNFGALRISITGSQEEKSIHPSGIAGQPDYQLKAPGRFQVPDAAEVLSPGTGMAVLARQVDGERNAVQVLVKPDSPTITPGLEWWSVLTRKRAPLAWSPPTGILTLWTYPAAWLRPTRVK